MIIKKDVDLTKEEVRALGIFNDIYIDILFEHGQDAVKLKCKEYTEGKHNYYQTYAELYEDLD